MVTRILGGGQADLQGSTIGGLAVGDISQRRPLRWNVECINPKCGARFTASHTDLQSGKARCLRSGCGRESVRDVLDDNPRKAAAREQQLAAKRREAEETAEAARLVEEESKYAETSKELGKVMRERLTKMPDDGVFIEPSTLDVRMTKKEAHEFNRKEAAIFQQRNPNLCPLTDATIDALQGYFDRNAIKIVSALTIEAAYQRLRDYGLIEDRQAPVPGPQPVAKPQRVNLEIERPQTRPDPGKPIGIDPFTGEPREYSQWEVNRMTADQFKKVFALTREKLMLPNHAAF